VLWFIVTIGVLGTVGIRIAQRRVMDRIAPPATKDPVGGIPVPRDYVADPLVEPAERNNGPATIVSLAPSLTETCCALGLLDRLAGRTQYCINPPAIGRVPVIGALVDANLEQILSIRPEMILISKNAGRVGERLTELKLSFEALTDDSLGGVFAAIERIGELTDRRRTAARLIGNLHHDLAAISMAARTRRPQRVLIVEGDLPVPPRAIFVAGPGLFLSELLTRLGHVNAAEAVVHARSGELSLEQIVTLNPDVILEVLPTAGPRTPEAAGDLYRTWRQIGAIRAIENRAVRSYGTPADLVCSPRINIVYYQLAKAMAEWR